MNNNKPEQPNKMKDLLDRIQSNELTPRSRAYFRLRFLAFVLVSFVMLIVTVFLSSLILFTLRESGHAALIGFGPSGWQVFLVLFPWSLTGLLIILVLIFEKLLRTFRFGYRLPVLYLFAGLAVLMVLFGAVVDETSLHESLLRAADLHRLPSAVRGFYDDAREVPPSGYGIYSGVILGMSGSSSLSVSLDDPDDLGSTTPVIVLLPTTGGTEAVVIGDRVFIRGKLSSSTIDAEGIRDADDQLPPLPPAEPLSTSTLEQ